MLIKLTLLIAVCACLSDPAVSHMRQPMRIIGKMRQHRAGFRPRSGRPMSGRLIVPLRKNLLVTKQIFNPRTGQWVKTTVPMMTHAQMKNFKRLAIHNSRKVHFARKAQSMSNIERARHMMSRRNRNIQRLPFSRISNWGVIPRVHSGILGTRSQAAGYRRYNSGRKRSSNGVSRGRTMRVVSRRHNTGSAGLLGQARLQRSGGYSQPRRPNFVPNRRFPLPFLNTIADDEWRDGDRRDFNDDIFDNLRTNSRDVDEFMENDDNFDERFDQGFDIDDFETDDWRNKENDINDSELGRIGIAGFPRNQAMFRTSNRAGGFSGNHMGQIKQDSLGQRTQLPLIGSLERSGEQSRTQLNLLKGMKNSITGSILGSTDRKLPTVIVKTRNPPPSASAGLLGMFRNDDNDDDDERNRSIDNVFDKIASSKGKLTSAMGTIAKSLDNDDELDIGIRGESRLNDQASVKGSMKQGSVVILGGSDDSNDDFFDDLEKNELRPKIDGLELFGSKIVNDMIGAGGGNRGEALRNSIPVFPINPHSDEDFGDFNDRPNGLGDDRFGDDVFALLGIDAKTVRGPRNVEQSIGHPPPISIPENPAEKSTAVAVPNISGGRSWIDHKDLGSAVPLRFPIPSAKRPPGLSVNQGVLGNSVPVSVPGVIQGALGNTLLPLPIPVGVGANQGVVGSTSRQNMKDIRSFNKLQSGKQMQINTGAQSKNIQNTNNNALDNSLLNNLAALDGLDFGLDSFDEDLRI